MNQGQARPLFRSGTLTVVSTGMTLYEQLRAEVDTLVDGAPLGDLRRWLRRHERDLASAGDSATVGLYDTVSGVVAEYLNGDRTEGSVRVVLQSAVAPHGAPADRTPVTAGG